MVQPHDWHLAAVFLCCCTATVRVLVLTVSPLQLVSYPAVRAVGIRMGLPLPSAGKHCGSHTDGQHF
ncbi:hypothetical protein E2562_029167 [Oryza meyeriana var. granulata]|uniref:Uncharacterized protein n=1 Tax=Oryza meyeriana var. granulata TaxID=110450 RepID=A0A6G1E3M3_9ORYZ|nr:hypothetical protein E2562_029167 [Oryza meyeriana var. granulata]